MLKEKVGIHTPFFLFLDNIKEEGNFTTGMWC